MLKIMIALWYDDTSKSKSIYTRTHECLFNEILLRNITESYNHWNFEIDIFVLSKLNIFYFSFAFFIRLFI